MAVSGRLSPRQERMLQFIRDFRARHGYPPTVREIGKAAGISSTSVVDYNLNILEKSGIIKRDRSISRGIDVAEEAGERQTTFAVPVVGQIAVGGKTNEHKEALRLLGMLPLEGRVVTGDAMFTHRDVADEILKGGGDYLLSVKDNQPTLRKDIEAALHDERGFSPLPTRP